MVRNISEVERDALVVLHRFSLLTLPIVLSVSLPLRAETEPIHLEYAAVAGCPSRAEFERRVFTRTLAARLTSQQEASRVFSVTLRRTAQGFNGSLVIRERDGANVERQLSGKRCDDLASVLALASALAIDPRAQLAEVPSSEDAARDPSAWDAEDAARPRSSSGTRTGSRGAGSSSSSADPDAPRSEATYADYRSFRTGPRPQRLGVGPRFVLGVGPQPSTGVALHWAHELYAAASRPSLGLELAWLYTPDEVVRGATAELRLWLARPQGCPLGWQLGDVLVVSPCVVAELGALSGRGTGLPEGTSITRFWAAAELLVRLESPPDRTWLASLDLGALFPFTRYRFQFDAPETRIHDVPAVTPSAALRVGVRFGP